jgi:hypothetical protein
MILATHTQMLRSPFGLINSHASMKEFSMEGFRTRISELNRENIIFFIENQQRRRKQTW